MNYLEEFGDNTDFYYDECSKGLSRLERIIVSISSEDLSSWCRAYLIPTAYAYWERFFRLSFGEFLNALNNGGFDIDALDIKVVARIRRNELSSQIKDLKILMENYSDCYDLESLNTDGTILDQCSSGLKSTTFHIRRPGKHIKTYSNVKFTVIEEHFKKFNLSFSTLLTEFSKDGIDIKKKLGDFVELRNSIGHGDAIGPLGMVDWNNYIDLLLKLMNLLQHELYDALSKSPNHKIFQV